MSPPELAPGRPSSTIWSLIPGNTPVSVTKVSTEHWMPGSSIHHIRRINHALLLVTGGRGEVVLAQGEPLSIARGSVVLLAPAVEHVVRSDARHPLSVGRIAWEGPAAAELAWQRLRTPSAHWRPADFRPMLAEHRAMMRCAADADGRLIADMLLHHLQLTLIHLARACVPPLDGLSPMVRQARRWLETHHTLRVRVADAADASGISSAHLCRRFREECGETAHGYLTRLRSRTAIDLISEGRSSLSEIADQFGYDDPQAFGKAFARWTGHPPTWFRGRGE